MAILEGPELIVEQFNQYFHDQLSRELYKSIEDEVETYVKSLRENVRQACKAVAKDVKGRAEWERDRHRKMDRFVLELYINGEKQDIEVKEKING